MGTPLKQLGLVVGTLIVGGGAGWFGHQTLGRSTPEVEPSPAVIPAVQTSLAANETAPLPDGLGLVPQNNANFIAAAVEQVGAAVVRIDSDGGGVPEVPPAFQNPFFRRFFGDEIPQPSPGPGPGPQGTGSGFIISTDGEIITNAHVVEGASTVTVTLTDGRTYQGVVVGTDSVTDVAAVKIEATDMPTVPLGTTENLAPGQWAIAIGNPLGLDNTVTAGIISALGRSSTEVGIPDKRVQFIQTDAAINPGNSGGPLLNDRGQVIGMNTAIRRDAQGLGFAIPVETFQRIARQLFETGEAQHPYLGIQMAGLTPETVERINRDPNLDFRITAEEGVLILRVLEDTPAEAGGLQPGDIIQSVGGVAVSNPAEVQAQVDLSQIGQPLMVEVDRNGRTERIEVSPTTMPANQGMPK